MQKLLALGVYPSISLAAAPEERESAKRGLKQGIDPSASKKAAREAPFATVTTAGVEDRLPGAGSKADDGDIQMIADASPDPPASRRTGG
ncbi:DUF4102 domain-containing protein [Starkeya sp. ORNL1]|nr:DUF4102 domain-containing protein [Starkeya sp. ORNL1]